MEERSRSSPGRRRAEQHPSKGGGSRGSGNQAGAGEDPKAAVVPRACGSQARTAALGITYRDVGLPGKATWEKGEEQIGAPRAPKALPLAWSRRSERSPVGLGFAAHPQNWSRCP